jgi:hypothetical protein
LSLPNREVEHTGRRTSVDRRAGYRFVADKTFPDIEWARPTCLYETTLTT